MTRLLTLAAGWVAGSLVGFTADTASNPAPATDAAALSALVRADWEEQEKRLGRSPESLEAVQAAVQRAARLFERLRTAPGVGGLEREETELRSLRARAADHPSLANADRRALYERVRTLTREAALKNPLVSSQPVLFLQRRRAVGYMLYEYLGWYYAHGNNPENGARNPQAPTPLPGGGVYLLEQPGRSLDARELVGGPEWHGHFVTLALSFDARTAYFAFADPRGEDPYALSDYARAPGRPGARYNTFHIWAMDVEGTAVRQLTDGPYDDFDPCPLPDGGLAFPSTRRGGKLRCGGGSPEQVYTLHRLDGEGREVRQLSAHETHEWHPSMLNDGRLVYTRWDYVDRNAAKFHGLWTCLPDGTRPANLFGNYTTRPWACYQAKAVPHSNRILFVAGGHHANVGGTLVLLDPSRASLDPTQGEDRFEALEWLTPEVCFPEAEGWPRSYFYSPWPLSEDFYLVAFSHDPLPGGYTGRTRESETGLYYLDRFGNLELLFRRPGFSAVYPVPLRARPSPPPASQPPDPELGAEGEFLLADVQESLLPLPPGRPLHHLRVFQLLPKSRTDRANDPRIGHPAESNARMLLGTVPLEADGSAYFRAPAGKPLYFQAVDRTGRAVQGMRTIVYLQPGERRGCVGCHEHPAAAPPPRTAHAFRRAPSTIQPGPDGSHPFGFPRLIQPVLDRHCVRCHDGSTGPNQSPPNLTGRPAPQSPFSLSYESLQPYVRWPSYDAAASRPGQAGADLSPLSALLLGERHRHHVEVPDEDLRLLYLWLDAQVPFYGTYEEEALAAQQLGQPAPPPDLQ